MNKISLTSVLLRIGLVIVFLYAAIASLLDPVTWASFLPAFLRNSASANTLLIIFSIVEILLSLWLLSGKKIFFAAVVSAFILAGIIASNLGILGVTFRDFGILFAALALAALSYEQ